MKKKFVKKIHHMEDNLFLKFVTKSTTTAMCNIFYKRNLDTREREKKRKEK